MTSEVERVIADLSGDPLLAGSDGSPAPVIVWDAAIARVLYASATAGHMRALVADPDGRVRLDGSALARLKALSNGLATGERFRLELMRFDRDRPSPATMLACRRIDLPGGPALMTVLVGGVPELRRHKALDSPPHPAPDGTPDGPGLGPTHAEPEPASASDVRRPTGAIPAADGGGRPRAVRQPRRFLWSADAQGRVTSVSASLAEIVGPALADIVGRTFRELADDVIVDPAGAIAHHLASGQAWHGVDVGWRIAEPGQAIPVTLGATPLRGIDGQLEGFRGSGLARSAEAVAVPDAVPPVPNPAAEAGDAGARPVRAAFVSLSAEVGAQLGERVAPFKPAAADASEAGAVLSFAERGALHEIARALGARMADEHAGEDEETRPSAEIVTLPSARTREVDPLQILDRVPVGIAVLRGDMPIFLNARLLGLLGYPDLAQTVAHGGAAALALAGRQSSQAAGPAVLVLESRSGAALVVETERTEIAWGELPATLVTVTHHPEGDPAARLKRVQTEWTAERARSASLATTLDLSGIGTATLDELGRVRSLNAAAERFFGYDQREIVGEPVASLLAPRSQADAIAWLTALDPAGAGAERRVVARLRDGRDVPLLLRARREGETASGAILLWWPHSDPTAPQDAPLAQALPAPFLARLSQDIRTPVNAIGGVAELMLEERFGPIGSERYRSHLRDIRRSATEVVESLTELMGGADIAAGAGDLLPGSFDLNDVVAESVARLQTSASREHVVMRTSLGANLAPVVADEGSLRQIALNVLANAIRYTGAGGQVIVSTARTDEGETAFRVRDTGIGMTEAEIDAALQPLGTVPDTERGGEAELGLPLSKALAEANRASFTIASGRSAGTLVEVVFPATRQAAE